MPLSEIEYFRGTFALLFAAVRRFFWMICVLTLASMLLVYFLFDRPSSLHSGTLLIRIGQYSFVSSGRFLVHQIEPAATTMELVKSADFQREVLRRLEIGMDEPHAKSFMETLTAIPTNEVRNLILTVHGSDPDVIKRQLEETAQVLRQNHEALIQDNLNRQNEYLEYLKNLLRQAEDDARPLYTVDEQSDVANIVNGIIAPMLARESIEERFLLRQEIHLQEEALSALWRQPTAMLGPPSVTAYETFPDSARLSLLVGVVVLAGTLILAISRTSLTTNTDDDARSHSPAA